MESKIYHEKDMEAKLREGELLTGLFISISQWERKIGGGGGLSKAATKAASYNNNNNNSNIKNTLETYRDCSPVMRI